MRRRRCTTPRHTRKHHTRSHTYLKGQLRYHRAQLHVAEHNLQARNPSESAPVHTTARVHDACVRVTHLHYGRSKRHFACILDRLTNQEGDRTEDHYEAGDADEDRPHHVWTCRALCAVQFAVPWLANTAKRASVPAHTTNHQQLSARQHHDTHASQAGTTRTPLHTPPERRASRRHHFRRWW